MCLGFPIWKLGWESEEGISGSLYLRSQLNVAESGGHGVKLKGYSVVRTEEEREPFFVEWTLTVSERVWLHRAVLQILLCV